MKNDIHSSQELKVTFASSSLCAAIQNIKEIQFTRNSTINRGYGYIYTWVGVRQEVKLTLKKLLVCVKKNE